MLVVDLLTIAQRLDGHALILVGRWIISGIDIMRQPRIIGTNAFVDGEANVDAVRRRCRGFIAIVSGLPKCKAGERNEMKSSTRTQQVMDLHFSCCLGQKYYVGMQVRARRLAVFRFWSLVRFFQCGFDIIRRRRVLFHASQMRLLLVLLELANLTSSTDH